jgi:predicted acetyltransferase
VQLVDPHPRLQRSFHAALDELVAAGEEFYARLHSWPAEGAFPGIDVTRASLTSPEVFAGYCRFLLEQRDPFAPRPRAYVPFTELWLAEGPDLDEYLARISLRHELTEPLLEWGGHIGYVVRPTARRRGVASAALAGMLEVCRKRGIDPVLVTCDVDNVGSRRTIERAGGRYEDTRLGKLRYWISLDPTR